MTAHYAALSLTVDGYCARIELQRPDKGNAFDETLHSEFSRALADVRGNSAVRVLLLTGQGKAFSAGGDFDYIRSLNSDQELWARSFAEGEMIFNLLTDMPFPVIAALHGHAMGLGATIAGLCDIIVAWRGAKIGDPHVLVGLVAGDGGIPGWTAAIGSHRARRHLLTGDPMTAEQAHAFGFVTDLAETPEDCVAQAQALAARIAALPPLAVQGTKRAFNAMLRAQTGEAQRIAFEWESRAMASTDVREALDAIQEKRAGVFTGK